MEESNIKSIIALQRMNNHFLSLVDSAKSETGILLTDLLDKFYSPYENVDKNYRTGHSFFNQYQLISSLYVYIVLPKEHFFNAIPQNLETISLKPAWGINTITPPLKLKYLIRRMRNAISHGNIEFSEKLEFTFTDTNPRDDKDKFCLTLTHIQLIEFIQALASWCTTKDIDLNNLEKAT